MCCHSANFTLKVSNQELTNHYYDRNALPIAENTPADYSHICVNQAALEVLESTLLLSVTRPDQYEYGVLKKNRVTGAILFGPPGTGKTLLVQAVARKCGLRLLSISASNILDSLWGSAEKNVRSIFRLARKMHPCLVFVDEADGILAKRRSDEKTTYLRTMLGEFLRHWDGAFGDEEKSRNPFVLLASNTPWDIDPAALRRAPVRIYLDLPTFEERKGILEIMLRDETLGPDVSIDMLARLTRSFSGSDIKNLCVSAATRCLQEQQQDEHGKYEEKRVLLKRHFDFALRFVKPTATDLTLMRKMAEFQRAAH